MVNVIIVTYNLIALHAGVPIASMYYPADSLPVCLHKEIAQASWATKRLTRPGKNLVTHTTTVSDLPLHALFLNRESLIVARPVSSHC